MRRLRIVYMGTPSFAVPSMERMVADKHDIVAVFTQPDRPKGRGQKLVQPPVKEAALAHNLQVFQPEKIKHTAVIEQLTELQPDAIVVVAFGQFLPKQLLELPPFGCINVHASLLPYYRGAAPIHWAIMNGEPVSGVTTMYMDVGMDTGDMILKAQTEIGENETTGELHDRLAGLGAEVLSETMRLVAQGKAPRQPQNHEIASYASLISREHEKIDWSKSAQVIHNQVRGLNPWPGAYAIHQDKIIKVWRTKLISTEGISHRPGAVEAVIDQKIIIQCGQGKIALEEVQPANKRRMASGEFARGYSLTAGQFFS